LFTNNAIVGYFAAAEKIVKAVQGLLGPVSQTIYPYISKLMNESVELGIKFIRKATFIIGGISFGLSLILFIFADSVINILLGPKYYDSVVVLKILAFLPFIIALSNILGIQTMLTLNYKKEFSSILILASIINIISALIMVPILKHIGISLSVLLSEIFVTISMIHFLNKKGIKIIGAKLV
jgi:PST family polysaccharide transporter